MKEAFSTCQLTVCYGKRVILWDVDVAVPAGQLIAVIGPNGAGKSTLLKSMVGIVPTFSGSVELLGEKSLKNAVYVPQYETIDWNFPMTLFELVLMGCYRERKWAFWTTRSERERVHAALKRVGLEAYKNRQIDQLSGGQKQRLFLARALVQEAQLFLLDEPFAGIDAPSTQAILEILKELVAEGKSVVVVHHKLEEVREHFDWTLLLNRRVVANGPTKEVFASGKIEKAYGQSGELLDQAMCLVAEHKGGIFPS